MTWQEKFPIGSLWHNRLRDAVWEVVEHRPQSPRPLGVRIHTQYLSPAISTIQWHKEDGSFLTTGSYDLVERYYPPPEEERRVVVDLGQLLGGKRPVLADAKPLKNGEQITFRTPCDCSKEKHGFWFHASWCPLYSPPMRAAVEVSGFIEAPDFRTHGDRMAELDRANEKRA